MPDTLTQVAALRETLDEAEQLERRGASVVFVRLS